MCRTHVDHSHHSWFFNLEEVSLPTLPSLPMQFRLLDRLVVPAQERFGWRVPVLGAAVEPVASCCTVAGDGD